MALNATLLPNIQSDCMAMPNFVVGGRKIRVFAIRPLGMLQDLPTSVLGKPSCSMEILRQCPERADVISYIFS